jgi:hypothetical protein
MKPFQLVGVLALLLLGPNDPPPETFYSQVSAWQSYCGSEPGRVHRWTQTAGELTVERLPLVSPTFHSGYAFTRDSDLIAYDRGSGEQFRFDAVAGSFVPVAAGGCAQFVTATHSFVQEKGDHIAACPIAGGECKIILIVWDSWPYVFAEHNGRVLAATNYGDVLIFDGADWCLASRSGDTYRCDPNEPMVTEPRGSSSTVPSTTWVKHWSGNGRPDGSTNLTARNCVLPICYSRRS